MNLTKLFVCALVFLNCQEIVIAQDEHDKIILREQYVKLTEAEIALAEAKEPTLYGGRRIRDGELKPSVYIGNCTATIVGPEVILTAGHCRSSGSSASFTYEGRRYSGRCTRHPRYNNRTVDNDWAFCKFSPKIDLPVYGSLEKHVMRTGDVVTMQGYGAGSGGHLNVGEATIVRIDSQDIITRGRVYLGGGDSGGGLFKRVGDLVGGPFIIVGVNSRGGGNTSLFNRADLERSRTFFEDYARSQSVEICGINWSCSGVDPDRCPEEQALVKFFEDELKKAKQILNSCQREMIHGEFVHPIFKPMGD